jgi:hypothetical protein
LSLDHEYAAFTLSQADFRLGGDVSGSGSSQKRILIPFTLAKAEIQKGNSWIPRAKMPFIQSLSIE